MSVLSWKLRNQAARPGSAADWCVCVSQSAPVSVSSIHMKGGGRESLKCVSLHTSVLFVWLSKICRSITNTCNKTHGNEIILTSLSVVWGVSFSFSKDSSSMLVKTKKRKQSTSHTLFSEQHQLGKLRQKMVTAWWHCRPMFTILLTNPRERLQCQVYGVSLQVKVPTEGFPPVGKRWVQV